MNPGHRIIYHCGDQSSHRLLLTRRSSACDSWRSYLYHESTGEQIYRSSENGPAEVERSAQLFALRNGISPILHSRESIAA
jgi:hypothetical protein